MKDILISVKEDKRILVEEDSRFILLPELKENSVENSVDRAELEFVFKKQGVSAEIVLLYVLPVRGTLNLTTTANHLVANTSCVTKVRGVMLDKSVSSYIGKINIAKDAQQTSSFLEDYVLVVGEKTKNNSQPILTIEADDVRASHGATTGRINQEQLYYLCSRGLSMEEAQKTIIDGFFAEVLETIADESIKSKVLSFLESVKF